MRGKEFDIDAPIEGAPDFTLAELIRSATARARGIDNYPDDPDYVFGNLQYLASMCLQPAREHFGRPLRISSGFRSAALNKAVGGSPASFHAHGCAADCEISGVPNIELFQFFHDQRLATELIAEELSRQDPNAGWVHVALMGGREGEMKEKLKFAGQDVRRASYAEIMAAFA